MTFGFIVLSAVVVAILSVLWRVWVARDAESRRAERAEAEADRWRKIGEGSEGVAHDVSNLLAAAFFDLHALGKQVDQDSKKAHTSVQRVRRALRAVTELLNALRVDLDGHPDDKDLQVTTEGHVRLQVAIYRSQVGIDASIRGNLNHDGHSIAAARVVQNLFHNAVREAKEAGGDVFVTLTDNEFTIRNRTRSTAKLDDQIYVRGASGTESKSTGLGLAVCREQAEVAGWRLFHRIEGDEVTFVCMLQRPSDRPLPPKSADSPPLKN